jgi:hypothetical protein
MIVKVMHNAAYDVNYSEAEERIIRSIYLFSAHSLRNARPISAQFSINHPIQHYSF